MTMAGHALASSQPMPCAPDLLRKQAALRRHVQRAGAALLNQQCWLWGCDIRRGAGNLLLANGFTRMRPPGGMDRSTQYTLAGRDCVVRLWGSGIFVGNMREGIFLNRFAFEPRCVAHHAVAWQEPAQLRRCPRYWDDTRLAQMCSWVAAYEDWVARECGVTYRRVCLAGFTDSVSQAERIAPEWAALAALLRGSDHHAPLGLSACPTQPALALNPLTTIAGC